MKTKEEIKKMGENFATTHEDVSDKLGKYLVNACFQDGYIQCQKDNDTSKVTRVEVVDETGRVYSKWDCSVELSYQDDGRTLKVFVK